MLFADLVVSDSSGCHFWIGSRRGRGYGQWQGDYAHRVAYRAAVGEIPPGGLIHHVCGVKLCVNPEHLELVTRKGHAARHRAEHCKRGHEFTANNTYVDQKTGARHCARCRRERQRAESWQGGIANRLKTHCKHGHPLSDANLIVRPNGRRACRACEKERRRKWASTPKGRATLRRLDAQYRARRHSSQAPRTENSE